MCIGEPVRKITSTSRGWRGSRDRLIRPKDFTSLTILDEFTKHNTVIITPAKTYNVGDNQDRLFLHIQAGFAGYEISLIRQRMEAGKHRAAKQGLKPAGANPLGYTFDKGKKMYVHTNEIHIVKQCIKMYKNGMSIRKIGVSVGGYNHNKISRILRNPMLYGEAFTTLQGKKYTFNAEPVISKKEWDYIQTKLDEGAKRYPGKAGHKHEHLLANILFTDKGEKMYCHYHLKDEISYYYSKKQSKFFKSKLIEEKLIEELKRQREIYTEQVYKLREKNKEDELILKEELLRHEKNIVKLNTQTKKLIDLYTEDIIDKKDLKERLSSLEVQKNHSEYEKKNTEDKLKDQKKYNLYTVYILYQLCELNSIKSFTEKKMLLMSCVDKIVWDISKKEIIEIVISPKGINISDYNGIINDFKKLITVSYDKDDKLKKFVNSHRMVYRKNNKSKNGTEYC